VAISVLSCFLSGSLERFEWTVRVGTSGKDRATAFARKHRFEVGPAVQFDADYERVTALEYVLGAVGADLAVGLDRLARQRRVPIDGVEAVVKAELDDPAAALGVVGAEGHPGLGRLSVKLFVSTLEDEAKVRAVFDEVVRRSPLARTLGGAVPFELAIKMTY
jgi:uncharacterized OsmC-like protein